MSIMVVLHTKRTISAILDGVSSKFIPVAPFAYSMPCSFCGYYSELIVVTIVHADKKVTI